MIGSSQGELLGVYLIGTQLPSYHTSRTTLQNDWRLFTILAHGFDVI